MQTVKTKNGVVIMDGKATKLAKYLDCSDKRFVIPVYQRNYSWKVENCRQLYDDLVKLIKEI